MELQPMDTAPRDGTRFRGKVGDDLIAMFWHPKFEAFVSRFRRMVMAGGYTIDGDTYSDHSPTTHEPTGWIPAPDLNE